MNEFILKAQEYSKAISALLGATLIAINNFVPTALNAEQQGWANVVIAVLTFVAVYQFRNKETPEAIVDKLNGLIEGEDGFDLVPKEVTSTTEVYDDETGEDNEWFTDDEDDETESFAAQVDAAQKGGTQVFLGGVNGHSEHEKVVNTGEMNKHADSIKEYLSNLDKGVAPVVADHSENDVNDEDVETPDIDSDTVEKKGE